MKCFYISIIALLIISAASAMQKAVVTAEVSEQSPLFGSPVRVNFEAKGNDITTVSWQLCDSLFTSSDLFNSHDTTFVQAGAKVCRHTVVFTSVKPGVFKARIFKAVVTYKDGRVDLLTLNLPAIRFRPDVNVSTVHEIKPVAEPGTSLFKLVIALMIVATIIYFFARYVIRKPKSTLSLTEVCSNHLKRIEKLKASGLNADMQADMAYRVLTDFLACTVREVFSPIGDISPILQDGDRRSLQEIIEMGDKLRFGTPSMDASEVGTYLANISSFISNFHSLKFSEVYE